MHGALAEAGSPGVAGIDVRMPAFLSRYAHAFT